VIVFWGSHTEKEKEKKKKTFTLQVFVSCARRTLEVGEQSYLSALKM
jgi:hypothetical protein